MSCIRQGAVLLAAVLLLSCAKSAVATGVYKPETYQALTSDARSFRVGDALTVLVVETSSGQTSADTTATRDTGASASASDSINQGKVGLTLHRDSAGKGKTTRSGSLQAQLSVRVQDVAANGDLAVYGTQKITVNGETQMISIGGIVRPIDVSSDNVVLSTRLTNAEITYSGRGFVDRNQREGWVSRLLGFFGL